MRYWMFMAGAALVAASPAEAQQQVQSPPDPYVHRATGFAFPASVGPFIRGAITEYDADAADVGANYDLIEDGTSVAVATIYVFPLPEDGGPGEDARCRYSYDGAKQAITDRFADAKSAREDTRPAPDADAETSGSHIGYTLIADFFAPQGAVASDLYLYCPRGSGWQVKYRTSAPAGGERDAAVQDFMRALEWPAKLVG